MVPCQARLSDLCADSVLILCDSGQGAEAGESSEFFDAGYEGRFSCVVNLEVLTLDIQASPDDDSPVRVWIACIPVCGSAEQL